MNSVAPADRAVGGPQSGIRNPPSGEPIAWRVHPARERPVAAACAAVAVAALAWGTADLMESPWWGFFAAAFMLVALGRFFLPSEYRIDADGITARSPWRTVRLRWRDIRRFVHDDRGALLSTRRGRSILDLFRGMHLIFGQNCELAVARIREAMHTEGRQA